MKPQIKTGAASNYHNKPEAYIIALNGNSENNERDLLFAMFASPKIANQPAMEGSYTMANGELVKERSYIIPKHIQVHVYDEELNKIVTKWIETTQRVKQLAKGAGQESILYLDAERTAYLWFLKSEEQKCIGKFRTVPKIFALGRDHTFDPKTGQYFVCD